MPSSRVTRLLTGSWTNRKRDLSYRNAVTTFHTTKDEEGAPAERSSTPAGPDLLTLDGGLTAWLQCAGSFALLLHSFGLIDSFKMIRQ